MLARIVCTGSGVAVRPVPCRRASAAESGGHVWLLVFLPEQRRKHRAPLLGQGEFARGVALDQALTTMVVTAAPVMPARSHSVLLATQNSSRRSAMLSTRACAAGLSGFGLAMRQE